ncbi:DUF475 domain-containing protein [Nocardia alni]|uniref:DUF475 domain-containing protein n=1 Tax=Nocardia alni TaxID=2815723 RepID=UPI001C236A8A|nr:DUF475 domain-containing protein [Nocardia alni]
MFVRVFAPSFIVAILALIVASLYGGVDGLILAAVLGVLEVSLSFDNAVVNAAVLERMSRFWQRMFLSVGVVIAVFGMRLLFPLLVVAIGAHLDPFQALNLALHPPAGGAPYFIDGTPSYETLLNQANPKIATFGGMFLLMLFLNFICTERETTWLSWLERPMARLGRFTTLPVVISLIVLVAVAGLVAPDRDADVVMVAGALGMATYLIVDGLGAHFDHQHSNGPSSAAIATGRAALFGFLYLEVLDASFSFDGVIGSFAITSDPIIIALGLGLIGAMFVRSITVYMVRKGTLGDYVYLEHGAHWAIGTLAVLLLWSTGHAINEITTGLIGVAIIAVAFLSSIVYNYRQRRRALRAHREPRDTTADPDDTTREGDGDAALTLHEQRSLTTHIHAPHPGAPDPLSAN